MVLITVFTPTYNRKHTLDRLYDSLINQTFKNFEWVIVDDGSSDGTDSFIQQLVDKNEISIKFQKQRNQGKHIAINNGLEVARGEFFFIVDSDDFLPYNSLEIISKKVKYLKGDVRILVGRKFYPNGKIIGKFFNKNNYVSNHIYTTFVQKHKEDLAYVVNTEYNRKFLFPIIEGEKFCAEGLIWNRMYNDGAKTFNCNDALYYCEYLIDGLSFNNIRNRRKSPKYTSILYKELAESNKSPVSQTLKSYINFWRFSFFNGKSIASNFKYLNFSILSLILLPLGILMKLKDDINDSVEINKNL